MLLMRPYSTRSRHYAAAFGLIADLNNRSVKLRKQHQALKLPQRTHLLELHRLIHLQLEAFNSSPSQPPPASAGQVSMSMLTELQPLPALSDGVVSLNPTTSRTITGERSFTTAGSRVWPFLKGGMHADLFHKSSTACIPPLSGQSVIPLP